MRGSDQAFASKSDAENIRESAGFHTEPAENSTEGSELDNRTALAAPDIDPERIAYRLWNEGRIDEAIEFLEREIAAERGRHRATALVPATGLDMRPVEPASDWRQRHKTALTKADFTAFGAAAHTIDVTATPADAILAHRAKRPSRRTWIMALIVAAGFGAAGMAVWAPPGDRQLAGVADSTPEPIPQAPAAVTEPAAVDDPRDSAQPAAGSALAVAPDAEVIEAPPPETEVVETPPPNPDALAELPPPPAGAAPIAPADDTASTITLPGELPSEPPTTASIALDPSAEEQAAALEAPLPRPRPEPSPEIVAALNAQPAPDVIPEPPVTGADVVPDVVPVYGPNGVRIYRPVRRLAGAPQRLPPVDPFFHPALTPAEYQALLERRAWAQHYAAQRRAGAAPRIITLP
jgi:hypothetical protein